MEVELKCINLAAYGILHLDWVIYVLGCDKIHSFKKGSSL